MSDTAAAESAPAPAPTTHAQFNFPDSDIALLSSDNVLFRVHRANLSAFSAVFKNMFTDGEAQPEPVSVTETSSTLAILLAMCYPSEDPPVDFSTLDAEVILACYEATIKYQMWVAGLALRSFVQPLVHLEPFLVVRLAYRLNDSVMMTAAAEEALKCDILANAREYAGKAGPDMWPRLLEFHYRRKMEVVNFLSSLEDSGATVYCQYCRINQRTDGKIRKAMLVSGKGVIDPASLQNVADLTLPCGHANSNPSSGNADKVAQFSANKCSF